MQFTVTALSGVPLIQPGDDLTGVILHAVKESNLTLVDRDVLVITSKIVSKAEGCIVKLNDVTPSEQAYHYAEITGKAPEIVEIILQESKRISRAVKGVFIVEHRLGLISANAGIDQSNIEDSDEYVLLLPSDPDATAEKIRHELQERANVDVGVVISDSHGRPFRMGTVGVAIGVAGLPALVDMRGSTDLFGRELKVTMPAYGDLIASTAQLAGGDGAEGKPIVLIRGLPYPDVQGTAADLLRPQELNLYP